jgi:hypothetical protein
MSAAKRVEVCEHELPPQPVSAERQAEQDTKSKLLSSILPPDPNAFLDYVIALKNENIALKLQLKRVDEKFQGEVHKYMATYPNLVSHLKSIPNYVVRNVTDEQLKETKLKVGSEFSDDTVYRITWLFDEANSPSRWRRLYWPKGSLVKGEFETFRGNRFCIDRKVFAHVFFG